MKLLFEIYLKFKIFGHVFTRRNLIFQKNLLKYSNKATVCYLYIVLADMWVNNKWTFKLNRYTEPVVNVFWKYLGFDLAIS